MLQICQYLLRNLSVSGLRKCVNVAARSLGSGERHNAGLIIIGDEILKAQVRDTNSHFMCSLLYECGVRVEKISVISDDVDVIAHEISEFSGRYKYVITSGGIGPTHDDMTFEGLARAFNDTLHHHPTMVDVVKEVYKTEDFSSPPFKIANIPRKASLRFGKDHDTGEYLKFPCVNVENVYVFPGSPIYLEKLFQSLCKELFKGTKKFVKKELYVDAKEESFAEALTRVSKEFPQVAFGSYPVVNESYYKARVTIESDDEHETCRARDRFTTLVSSEIFVNYDKSPETDAVEKFEGLMEGCRRCDVYLKTLEELRQLYEEPSEVAICFDGSIEATVLIHLAHIALGQLKRSDKINVVIFKYEEWFVEAESFVNDIINRYNLNAITLNLPPRDSIEKLQTLQSDIKILLLGVKTKSKDTGLYHNLLRQTCVPSIFIKCPLNGWTVDSLWTFARSLSLPYCSLYDKGFTCVGGRDSTKPNVNLITGDKETRQPAWKLNHLK